MEREDPMKQVVVARNDKEEVWVQTPRGKILARVAGKFVRKYTLRHYTFFFKEIQAKSAEFSTPS